MKAASWAIKRGDRANPIGQQFVRHIRSGSSILDTLKPSGWSSGLSLLPPAVEIVATPLRHFQAFFPVCAAMICRAHLVAIALGPRPLECIGRPESTSIDQIVRAACGVSECQ